MGASLTTSFAEVEVAGVSMDCDDHAAGSVGDSACGNVVKELFDGNGGLL